MRACGLWLLRYYHESAHSFEVFQRIARGRCEARWAAACSGVGKGCFGVPRRCVSVVAFMPERGARPKRLLLVLKRERYFLAGIKLQLPVSLWYLSDVSAVRASDCLPCLRVVHGKGLSSGGRSRTALRRIRWLKSIAHVRPEAGGKFGEEAVWQRVKFLLCNRQVAEEETRDRLGFGILGQWGVLCVQGTWEVKTCGSSPRHRQCSSGFGESGLSRGRSWWCAGWLSKKLLRIASFWWCFSIHRRPLAVGGRGHATTSLQSAGVARQQLAPPACSRSESARGDLPLLN